MVDLAPIQAYLEENWRAYATGAIVTGVIAVALLAIKKGQSDYAKKMADYEGAVAALDPLAVEKFEAATAYFDHLTDLRKVYAPNGQWGRPMPLQVFLDHVERASQLGDIAKNAGYTVEEAIYSVVVDRILKPGLSPIPEVPGKGIHIFFATCQIAAAAALAGGLSAVVWLDRD